MDRKIYKKGIRIGIVGSLSIQNYEVDNNMNYKVEIVVYGVL
ncbi:hypothetical protein [uncultured Tyzzerella sp.]|nr:hypothetical protein [uncultured Tyzzerella sp.]